MKSSALFQSLLVFLREEDGPTAVEYAVMLALIVVVCLSSIGALTDATARSFDNSATAITGAFAN